MEVKINKEIQSYSESMFFGLSMRQCGFSLAAMLVAVGLYFLLKPYVGTETVSWMCILGAAPFAAIAPIPLSTFAGEPTQSIGKSFLKSYASVCLEGAVIVLACVIFSAFASSPPVVDAGAAAATMVWSYIGELIFNMLILVGAVKMADRLVKEMMGI